MKITDAPALITTAFAQNGLRNDIPANRDGLDTGRASFTTGFPDETMKPITAGGVPPFGADFNGILYALTNAARFYGAGGHYQFNGSFAAAIGGYPMGATVQASDNMGHWLNVVESNNKNPESALSTGWLPLADHNGTTTVNISGNTTLTPLQAAKANIRFTGSPAGNSTITFPAWTKRYSIINDCTGDQSLICTTGNGESISIKNGAKYEIGCDGKNLTVATVNASQVFAESNKKVSSLDAPTVQQIINALGSAAKHNDSDFDPSGSSAKVQKNLTELANSLSTIAKSGKLNDGTGVLGTNKGGTGRNDGNLQADTVFGNGSLELQSSGGETGISLGKDGAVRIRNNGNLVARFAKGGELDVGSMSPRGLTTDVPIEKGGTGAHTKEDARANLGLGSASTMSSTTISYDKLTGRANEAASTAQLAGLRDRVTPVERGGTGGTNEISARKNLGLGNSAVLDVSQVAGNNSEISNVALTNYSDKTSQTFFEATRTNNTPIGTYLGDNVVPGGKDSVIQTVRAVLRGVDYRFALCFTADGDLYLAPSISGAPPFTGFQKVWTTKNLDPISNGIGTTGMFYSADGTIAYGDIVDGSRIYACSASGFNRKRTMLGKWMCKGEVGGNGADRVTTFVRVE